MKVFWKLSSKITICYREALKTASELANLSYNFVLSENITLLKFWERMDPSELYVDIPLFCSIDIPLFCSKFSKFSFFLLQHLQIFLYCSCGQLPTLLSENPPNFRHLLTGLQNSQFDSFDNIQFSCIPLSGALKQMHETCI